MRFVVLLVALGAIVALVACSRGGPEAAVNGVTIDQGDVTLVVGTTVVLTASVDTVGAAPPSVSWSSADTGVATVTPDGVVAAIAEGATSITATSTFDERQSATVIVSVAPPPSAMQLDVDTSLIEGTAILLALRGDVDVVIDWGDGDRSVADAAGDIEHAYASEGRYTISVGGSLTGFGGGALTDPEALDPTAAAVTEVTSWGALGLTSLAGALAGATNLGRVPDSLPGTVTDTSHMFAFASTFDQDIGSWDTRNVEAMRGMFLGAAGFDQDLSGWCVEAIADEPEAFAEGAVSWTRPRPVWGTCPSSPGPAPGITGVVIDGGDRVLEVGDAVVLTATVIASEGVDASVAWSSGSSDVATVTAEGGLVEGIALGSAVITATSVSDARHSDHVTVTVVPPSEPMRLEVDTRLITGTTVSLPLRGDVDVAVDWGDGNRSRATSSGDLEHTYASDGSYLIEVRGSLTHLGRGWHSGELPPHAAAITRVIAWGDLGLTSLSYAFYGAVNLVALPEALPVTVTDLSRMLAEARGFNQDIGGWDTSNVTNMAAMFDGAAAFDQPIGGWDTSNVTNMAGLFARSAFNRDIGGWDTGRVTAMQGMFAGNTVFDQPIGGLDTSHVTSMGGMFAGATAFDQDIGGWDVSRVTDMSYTFRRAASFDQDIGGWDVSRVTTMSSMFAGATAFDRPIGAWDVSSVTTMNRMFMGATAFDQDLGGWDVSNVTDTAAMFFGVGQPMRFNGDLAGWDVSSVTDMTSMFSFATRFDRHIGAWDVSAVTSMNGMFAHAASFDQDLDGWDVSSVTDMGAIFLDATSFDGPIGSWNVARVTNMSAMFSGAAAFDQPIGSWDVSNVTNMRSMFASAARFNQDIGDWDTGSVTDMSFMFAVVPVSSSPIAFDQDIGRWNVSAVTTLAGMFHGNAAFDQPIGDWDTGRATDMSFMFYWASAFDQDIGAWDTGNVTTMNQMFYEAHAFDRDIGAWDTAMVTDMAGMFDSATSFNQPIGAWDTGRVTSMRMMFYRAHAFDQDISGWDTSQVTETYLMFYQAWSFDQPIGSWDTSRVTYMGQMFQGASSFNADLGAWDTGSVTSMLGMFNRAEAFNQDIGGWDVRRVYDMDFMFSGASAFDQDLSRWCVEQIPWEPTSFDDGVVGWTSPRPVWGTCPGTEAGIVVDVMPRDVTLQAGGSASFTATVSAASDASVTWSATCGTIDGAGDEAVFTAPATPGDCLVTATSVANAAAQASATVTVRDGTGAFPHVVWTRQFGTGGTDVARGVATDALGHVYVVGSTSGSLAGASAGGHDAFVRAFDADGATLWTRQFGSPGFDVATGVAVDPFGAVVVAGESAGTAFVRTYDADGNEVWDRPFAESGEHIALGVATDASGNVYVTGATTGALEGMNASVFDVFVRKYDVAGNEMWTRQFGTAGYDAGFAIAVDDEANVVAVGRTRGPHDGVSDVFVWKADADGRELWTRRIGTPNPDEATGVVVDGGGDVLVAGITLGSLGGPNAGDYDGFLRRYSPEGEELWTRQFGTQEYDHVFGIAIDGAGNVVVAGMTAGAFTPASTGTRDAVVLSYDPDGTLLWTYQFGTDAEDLLHAAAFDASGDLLVVGRTMGSLGAVHRGEADAFVRKLRP